MEISQRRDGGDGHELVVWIKGCVYQSGINRCDYQILKLSGSFETKGFQKIGICQVCGILG